MLLNLLTDKCKNMEGKGKMIVGLCERGQRPVTTSSIFKLSSLKTFEDQLGFNDIFAVSFNGLSYKGSILMAIRQEICTFAYVGFFWKV